jgi:phospholipase/lecithinase/hemolysin
MKTLLKCAFGLAVMGLGLVPANVLAANCDVYAFGDSLSDTGAKSPYSAFARSGYWEPPSIAPETVPYPGQPIIPPYGFYSEGRYSDGKVWVEYLAGELCPGGKLTSFARGGAFSDDRNANQDLGVKGGLRTQVFEDLDDVLGDNGTFGPNDIVTVWAFSNNVVFDLRQVDSADAVRDVGEAVQELADRGARRILVLNAPNIGDTPFGRFLSEQTIPGLFRNLNARVTQYNNMLDAAVRRLNRTLGGSVALLDINTLFRAILTNPDAFGFANAAFPCMVQNDIRIRVLTGACPVDDSGGPLKLFTTGTVFYDLLHPTDAVHYKIADVAKNAVPAADQEYTALAR